MAMECALYIDTQTLSLSNNTKFSCGIDDKGNPYILNIGSVVTGNITTYNLTPSTKISSSTDSCFRITITKNNETTTTKTTILANGFNICNESNTRTVERTIEVNY